MLGTCPQIMAVLGSLILYVLGKYLGVQWEGRIDPSRVRGSSGVSIPGGIQEPWRCGTWGRV